MNGVQSLDTRPLVAIALPCGDMLHSEMAQCLWGVGRGSGNCRQGLVMAHSSIVAAARNNCVNGAIQCKADYIMFIDSDMVFPPNTINRLLAHKKDIVGATYVRRGPPFDNLGASIPEHADRRSGLVEMTHIPTGMLLIKTSVFSKFKPPYFRFGVNEVEGILDGEDMLFSTMARERGFQLFCDLDLSVELRHIYTYMLAPKDPSTRAVAENFKKAHEEEQARIAANG